MKLADTVAEMLELERLDTNLYRGTNPVSVQRRQHLYGGQVAAQALMAAGLTVPDGRAPHSLHGYFLRRGQTDKPVILRVDPDRDGGSFSARHVAAIQDGEVIFSMLASFHQAENEHRLDNMPSSQVPPPGEAASFDREPLVLRSEVTLTEVVDGRQLFTDCVWLRLAHPLPADALSQACGLTYLSDLGSGFGRQTAEVGNGGPSLDHAIWFHSPARADEWTLLHMFPRKATQIRGLYDAAMRDLDGNLCAVVAQENLLLRR